MCVIVGGPTLFPGPALFPGTTAFSGPTLFPGPAGDKSVHLVAHSLSFSKKRQSFGKSTMFFKCN